MVQQSIQLLFVLFFSPTLTKSCVSTTIVRFKWRNHWNSWANHNNHQLYSEWSQNWQQKWVWLVCKGELSLSVHNPSIVLPTSALRNMNVVTRKLDPDQTSVVHTHNERNKCDKTCRHIVILGLGNVDCTGWLLVGRMVLILLVFFIAGTAYR